MLVIVMVVLYLACGLQTGTWRWRRTALDLPLLAFVASSALSTVVAVNHNIALFGSYIRYEGLLTIFTYAALFWLTVQLMSSAQDARALGRSMLAGAYLVSILAIFQSITGWGPGVETSVGACVRAFATFGSPVELGTFLAMVLPLALYEVLDAGALSDRVIAVNVLVVLTLALLLTFTRAAWGAALIGGLIVLAVNAPPRRVWLVASGALAVLLIAGFVAARIGGASSIAQCVSSRAQSAAVVTEGSVNFRLHVWSDSLQLIKQRPLLGSGPDSFGLVYPVVQSENWTPGSSIDKAHNDLLQLAVTNGLIGVLADLFILLILVRSLWRNRRVGWRAAILAGLLAYEVALQAEFSWIPAAIPFWILAAAAFSADETTPPAASWATRLTSWPRRALIAALAGAGLVLMVLAVVPDYRADQLFFQSLSAAAADRNAARSAVASARRLNPHESVYAVEAGNLDVDLAPGGRPGPGADLRAARAAFEEADRLGTANPAAFRSLALADLGLGDRTAAIRAARRAVALNRFDPANQALLDFLQTQ